MKLPPAERASWPLSGIALRGVAQALHLVSLVLFAPPGRIMLIDEPHAYLHPGAERRLVRFQRDRPEHAYVRNPFAGLHQRR